jgi:RsmE family RNA methyltransferase
MNLVLFEPGELDAPLPVGDPRAQHILKVLRRSPGETFVAGLVNGPLGTATFQAWHGRPAHDSASSAITLTFTPEREPPPLPPVTLLVGLPRPQTARDLLRDAATLGVARIHFITTERADPNYAASSLWTTGEWRRHLLNGAAQACDTRIPEVTWTHTLATALSSLPAGSVRLALDNYEATTPLSAEIPNPKSQIPNQTILALGPERGWSPADRTALRAASFTLCSLGDRVLRLETAAIAALTLTHYGNQNT